MLYRRLGSTGLQLSALSFGAWVTFGKQIARSEARNLIAAAWDNGINFFDNAEVYARGRAEEVMGDVIANLRLPRDGFCVSSKVFLARWTARVRPSAGCRASMSPMPATPRSSACAWSTWIFITAIGLIRTRRSRKPYAPWIR